MKQCAWFLPAVAVASCTMPQPPTIYSPRPRGAMDLTANLDARHCSELTRDFRDAYGLEDSVKDILSITVPADETSMTVLTRDGAATSSLVVNDRDRLRAFWRYDDWTLAAVLDRGKCKGGACPAEISMIRYNGAKTPSERPSRLCFERWVGTFTRQRRTP